MGKGCELGSLSKDTSNIFRSRTNLKENPESSADHSNRPCDEPKEEHPKDCEEYVIGHFDQFLYKQNMCDGFGERKKVTIDFVSKLRIGGRVRCLLACFADHCDTSESYRTRINSNAPKYSIPPVHDHAP